MERSLDDILDSLDTTGERSHTGERGACITFWVTPEAKAKYDRIQQTTGRKFHKTAKELLLTAIRRAESKVG